MIDTTNQQSQEPVTILRIKRKRNEEPLDALVVESRNRRKKTKGGLGSLDDGMNVFQFAETVEPNTWDDEKQKQDLETRLSTLARESAQKKQNATPPRPVAPSKAEKDEKIDLSKPASPTPAEVSVPTNGTTEDASKSPTRQPPKLDDTARKYTIVPSTSAKSPEPEWSNRQVNGRLKAPPKVHSYKDLLKASLTMYDAIPSSTSLASSGDASVDPEVAKFLPMLTDYLKINGEDPLTPSGSLASNGPQEDDDDYVWDVFYSRPASFRDLYYGPGGKANIGTVTGLPGDEECSSDESEVEDEGDEDSNAEDWYKNDYPDEEDDRSDYDSEGSDIFHDASDFDDVVHERGTWDINF